MIKFRREKGRVLTLDQFKKKKTFQPDEPDVDKYIYWGKRTIYFNMAARPGAKITKLFP